MSVFLSHRHFLLISHAGEIFRVATILLVDDDPLVRRMLALVLSKEGFQVVPAQNGAEALTVLAKRAGDFDLLISDIEMPEVDGMQLAAAARTENPSMPMLLISGDCRLDATPVSACVFLPKPIHIPRFLRIVRQLTSKRHAHVAS